MSEYNEEMAVVIPYYVHEGEMSRLQIAHKEETDRLERIIKRLWVIILVIFLAFVGLLIYELQFETVDIDQQVETGTAPAVVSGTGDAIYGNNPTESENPGEEGIRNETMP